MAELAADESTGTTAVTILPKNISLVYFDLETTDASVNTCEIIQIGAKYEDNEFTRYIVPDGSITPGAKAVNGFSKRKRHLYKNGVRVPIELETTLQEALGDFLQFLRQTEFQAVLVAHNAERFDAPLLLRDLRATGFMDSFLSTVVGFVDTILVFRPIFPTWDSHGKDKLAQHYGISTAGAHDGLGDVNQIRAILAKAGIDDDHLKKFAKTVPEVVKGGLTDYGRPYGLQCIVKKARKDFVDLLARNVVTLGMLQVAVARNELLQLLDFMPRNTNNNLRIMELKEAVEAVGAKRPAQTYNAGFWAGYRARNSGGWGRRGWW